MVANTCLLCGGPAEVPGVWHPKPGALRRLGLGPPAGQQVPYFLCSRCCRKTVPITEIEERLFAEAARVLAPAEGE